MRRTAVRGGEGGGGGGRYVTYCIYLVREILFLAGKSQGIWHTDVCGNHALYHMVILLLRNNFYAYPRRECISPVKGR